MIEIKIWLVLVLLIEVPAIAMVALHNSLYQKLKAVGFDWLMLVGMYMLTIGLVVQVGRTNHYLKFNTYPVDEWFPFWVLKDIGGSIMLYCVVKLIVAVARKGT
jgi:hypothetical protein